MKLTTTTSPLARPDDEQHRAINDRTLAETLRGRAALVEQVITGADRPIVERIARAFGLVK